MVKFLGIQGRLPNIKNDCFDCGGPGRGRLRQLNDCQETPVVTILPCMHLIGNSGKKTAAASRDCGGFRDLPDCFHG